MFIPIKLMDFELSKPFPTIDGLEGYGFVQFLVRLRGTPIGYVRIPVINHIVSASATCKEVLKRYSWRIIRLLLIQGLKLGTCTGRIDFKKLLNTNQLASPSAFMLLVTVAICTRDRPEDLPLCLDSLNGLNYPNLDILIIENAPTSDDIQNVVTERYPHMPYVRELRPGLNWVKKLLEL